MNNSKKSALLTTLKTKARELKTNVSALYLAFQRKDTPLLAKLLIVVTVGYALSPIDIIPDFIPVLGYLDDLIILPFLIALSLKLIPNYIMDECKEQAKDLWKDGKPKKWRYAIPIIALYGIVIFWAVRRIFFSNR